MIRNWLRRLLGVNVLEARMNEQQRWQRVLARELLQARKRIVALQVQERRTEREREARARMMLAHERAIRRVLQIIDLLSHDALEVDDTLDALAEDIVALSRRVRTHDQVGDALIDRVVALELKNGRP